MAKKSDKSRVWRAMDAALQKAIKQEQDTEEVVLELQGARYIIFSDHHKATRHGNDDFRASERAYNAALAYYYAMGYTLITLGDVEELWEERTNPVHQNLSSHPGIRSQICQSQDRYIRFWGNHDDDWQYPERVKDSLWPIYGDGLKVHEGMVVRVKDGGALIGSLLLVHGHQGTLDSDDLRPIARPFVRRIWRPIQRYNQDPFLYRGQGLATAQGPQRRPI